LVGGGDGAPPVKKIGGGGGDPKFFSKIPEKVRSNLKMF